MVATEPTVRAGQDGVNLRPAPLPEQGVEPRGQRPDLVLSVYVVDELALETLRRAAVQAFGYGPEPGQPLEPLQHVQVGHGHLRPHVAIADDLAGGQPLVHCLYVERPFAFPKSGHPGEVERRWLFHAGERISGMGR